MSRVVQWPFQCPSSPSEIEPSNIWTSAQQAWTTGNSSPYDPITFFPFTLPSLGTKHNQRIGDRIRVSSIRFQIKVLFSWKFITPLDGNPFNTTAYNSLNPTALNWDTQGSFLPYTRWMKLRIMAVLFDKSVKITPAYINQWFNNTYLPYKPLVSGAETADYHYAWPVSVHSNMLHMTTDYTGKFRVVFDKCLTLYSNKPMLSIDQTIPLNMDFIFKEDGNELLSPNIQVFLLAPRDANTDIDQYTRTQWNAVQGTNLFQNSIPMFHSFCETKTNFYDL